MKKKNLIIAILAGIAGGGALAVTSPAWPALAALFCGALLAFIIGDAA